MRAGSQVVEERPSRSPRVLMLLEHGAASHWWEASIPLLGANGAEVVVMTVFRRGPIHANLEATGCCGPVLTLDCRSSRDYPRAAVRLAQLIRKHEIDIVHANETIAGTISGLAGMLARRGVRIFHRHHNIIEERQQVIFSRLASRLAHLTMAVSNSAAHHAQTVDGVSPDRIRVAYNGVRELRVVPTEEVRELRARLGIPAGAPIVTVVARFGNEKGHRTLLEAVPALAGALPQPLHLVFAGGGGPEEAMLRKLAETLSPAVAVVHFAGHQLDVAPWYALSDVVAVPSWEESFSLSAAEAMTLRRPVVASRVGGLPEVVEDGVTGVLVPPRDPAALADALVGLLRAPDTAAQMGEAGYRRYRERFTMRAMIESWQAVYEEALGAGTARRREGSRKSSRLQFDDGARDEMNSTAVARGIREE